MSILRSPLVALGSFSCCYSCSYLLMRTENVTMTSYFLYLSTTFPFITHSAWTGNQWDQDGPFNRSLWASLTNWPTYSNSSILSFTRLKLSNEKPGFSSTSSSVLSIKLVQLTAYFLLNGSLSVKKYLIDQLYNNNFLLLITKFYLLDTVILFFVKNLKEFSVFHFGAAEYTDCFSAEELDLFSQRVSWIWH